MSLSIEEGVSCSEAGGAEGKEDTEKSRDDAVVTYWSLWVLILAWPQRILPLPWWLSPVALWSRICLLMQEMRVWSQVMKIPCRRKWNPPTPSILAWSIPRTEKPGGQQVHGIPKGRTRVRDLTTTTATLCVSRLTSTRFQGLCVWQRGEGRGKSGAPAAAVSSLILSFPPSYPVTCPQLSWGLICCCCCLAGQASPTTHVCSSWILPPLLVSHSHRLDIFLKELGLSIQAWIWTLAWTWEFHSP